MLNAHMEVVLSQIATQVVAQAQELGYEVQQVEQVRSNRWLLTLKDSTDTIILTLVQQRPLISSADVQDLAELLSLRTAERGILLAVGGKFTPGAERTALELNQAQITLCTTLPPDPNPPRITPAFESL